MIKPPKGMGIFAWRRLLLTIALLLFVNGVQKWFVTPQEEDPQLPPRDGIVSVIYPGAVPQDAERLVVKHLEEELDQVEEVTEIKTNIRTNLIFTQIKINDNVEHAQTNEVWDKVQRALDRAYAKFPDTAMKPSLNRDIYDQDAVFLALYGTSDPLVLHDMGRKLKDQIYRNSLVKSIDVIATPGEQLSVRLDVQKLSSLGVSLDNFVRQLRGGNASVPSGQIILKDQKISVITNSFYKSAEELSKFPITLKSGETILLSQVGRVARTQNLPIFQSMRFNQQLAVGIGVVPKKGVNLQTFGEDVRYSVKEFQSSDEYKKSGLKIEEISYQPKYVAERVHEIGMDLLKAIVLVGGALMLMMGFRSGFIVAIQVPIVTVIAFGIFSWTGGVINQISIAAFILAIGLLVDNVVVIVDGIQSKLDAGLSALEAGEQTRKEYTIPLLAGTLTTIAAFMPMLISQGTSADFTRAIGVIATIALASSYFFCIFVTPLISELLLKQGKSVKWNFVEPLGEKFGMLVIKYSKIITTIAFCLVLIAGWGFGFVKKQFFPSADRDMLIVELHYPEGTSYQKTLESMKKLEEATLKDNRVHSVTSVVGRGVPPFYYNLPREPHSLQLAQMIVKTKTREDAITFKNDNQNELQKLIPFGTVIVKDIAQGPVVKAPLEVRVFSDDPVKLQQASELALAAVKKGHKSWKWRSTLGLGQLEYKTNVDDAAAGLYGLTRAEVSSVILAQTSGVPVTTFRGGDDPYSINLMSKENEQSTLKDIRNAYLGSTRSENLRIATVINEEISHGPSILEHFNREPVVYLYGQLSPGIAENLANEEVQDALAKLPKIDGVRYELAGAVKESKVAQSKMFAALPIGLFILLISLMYEFNSFRRVGIILLTVPLCAVGSVPGLLLTNMPFGFMTLIGMFALAGTVIHNGIFLIDYIDHRMHEGVPLDRAIIEGIQRRTRPIILTAVATLVELLPMTMSSSTLWPPFAWVIISGLLVSTLMTILVIPSVFRIAFLKESQQ